MQELYEIVEGLVRAGQRKDCETLRVSITIRSGSFQDTCLLPYKGFPREFAGIQWRHNQNGVWIRVSGLVFKHLG